MKVLQKKGFTLIEAVIAISILAIISVILLNIFFVGYNIRNTNFQRQEALKYATSVVDEIKSFHSDWKNIEGLKAWLISRNFSLTSDPNILSKEQVDSHQIRYEAKVIISENTGISGLFQLQVIINAPKVTNFSIITRFRG